MKRVPPPTSSADAPAPSGGPTRREFVRGATLAGAGLALNVPVPAQEPARATPPGDGDLTLAIIGVGSQGRNLLTKCLKIPGVRFAAVCDIWPYHQTYAANILKKYDQVVNVYDDYRRMLERERHLSAVIVATPDWVHAEQTVASLESGCHVYCEKEMSNTIDGARAMVRAAKTTGKLLQIGHQRRSNPRYQHALTLMERDRVLGRITHVRGQWNRARMYEVGWPRGKDLDAATLKRWGYDSMDRFRNWRWYRRYSGGPMADLGSHQVDVFNWFLKTPPAAVMAAGGLDYYTGQQGRDLQDNVMAIYEYRTADGLVRGAYQVLNTTSHGGFYETFMGDEGSMVISEDPRKGFLFREVRATRRPWEDESTTIEAMGREAIELKIGETLAPDASKDPAGQRLLAQSRKPVHQLHLENFFGAIRDHAPLSCPPEVGFETAVSVLRTNDAIERGCHVRLAREEFTA